MNVFHRGYFTFFAVVVIVASLNDYWKKLKLDVLFADVKANEIAKNDDNNDEQAEIEVSEKTVADDGVKGIVYKVQAHMN